jgi:hypothetical protein
MNDKIVEQLDFMKMLGEEIVKRDKQIQVLQDKLHSIKSDEGDEMAFKPCDADFPDLVGETISQVIGLTIGSREVNFLCKSGKLFRMHHYQECCENVELVDVVGEAEDIVNNKVVNLAEQVSNDKASFENVDADSYTWTFYNIQAGGCMVTLRWLGTSNGFYSERVQFQRIK